MPKTSKRRIIFWYLTSRENT